MKLTCALIALALALPIVAIPTPVDPTHKCLRKKANIQIKRACDVTGCILSLGGSVPSCKPAAAEGGLNPELNDACLASIGEGLYEYVRPHLSPYHVCELITPNSRVAPGVSRHP
ncbi:hypothetical protein BD410DRAFT_2701 [Rickenella mellea]|uniref:Fungal calcium binding protein domain-containing protein n=1 Tax=Rickenella mellea TaxID=50990 RepID=A0A4R5XDL2_9AGAM|nr:hypothetical protein BD410DRAFT_2701 [Rickenella mellea]